MFSTAFLDLAPMKSSAGVVHLPGSKSISNRVLLLAALAAGRTRVRRLLDSDDTRVMLEALRQLGCGVEYGVDGVQTDVAITGLAGQAPKHPAKLFLGNAGTAMRPLTAALAVWGGDYCLTGVPRMHQRPIGDLVQALRHIGCSIEYLGEQGFPPLQIGAATLKLDAPISVRGDVSSQFLTALLLALPLAATRQDIHIDVIGELISKPYVEITIQLLEKFGITVVRDGWRRFTIPRGSKYQSPADIAVEPDASSASYFIALGAIAAQGKESIRIDGLGTNSIQGDIHFIDAVRAMGAQISSAENDLEIRRGAWPLKAIDLDCNHIPDAAMTLAVLALFASGTTRLRNIASWRVKETDRIAAMAKELRKLGAQVDAGDDFIAVTAPAAGQWRAAQIHTYDDHRIAMCFALAAFNPDRVAVRIEDPQCVAKTFPQYFETLFSVVCPHQIPVICIDGPSASGKGALASRVAHCLGFHYLDSGALYRMLALAARTRQIAWDDEVALARMASEMDVRFEGQSAWLNGEDVTLQIRTEDISAGASQVSAHPLVRTALIDLQQRFARLPGLVADGRDMASVIFVHAPLKLYLTASAHTRAERRHKQLIEKGISANIDNLRADLEARDRRDQSRSVAPLKIAQDAVILDNSDQTIEETLAYVLAQWRSKLGL